MSPPRLPGTHSSRLTGANERAATAADENPENGSRRSPHLAGSVSDQKSAFQSGLMIR